jgi:hypothetical protein
MLAFLSPPRDPRQSITADWLPAVAAFGLGCAIKYPFLPIVLACLAMARALLFSGSVGLAVRDGLRFLFGRRGLISLLLIAACCSLYIHHWIVYKNPFYIIALKVGGYTIFEGHGDFSALDSVGLSSAAKPIGQMSWYERYYHSWTDSEVPLTVESFGGFGAALPFAMLLPAMAGTLLGFKQRDSWRIALALMLLFCLFFTPSHVPRYGLTMFILLVICAAFAFSFVPGSARCAWALPVLLLCVPGLYVGIERMCMRLAWCQDHGGLSWNTRSSRFVEMYDIASPWYASPKMIRYIRDHSGPGDELVWTVRTFPTLLLNRNWSNRPRLLLGTQDELWPKGAHLFPHLTREQLDSWVLRLMKIKPRHVLVYARSDYAWQLRLSKTLGYRAVFQDGSERGDYGMVLYERVTGPAATEAADAG